MENQNISIRAVVNRTTRIVALAAALVLTLGAAPAWAQQTAAPSPQPSSTPQTRSGYEDIPQFGGPNSVAAQLKDDDAVKESLFRTPLTVLAAVLGLAAPAAAQDDPGSAEPSTPVAESEDAAAGNRSRGFGGPDQVDNTIATDDETVSRIVETKIYEPWFEWKKGLQEKYGLAFSVDYSAAWLGASDSPAGAEDQASGGMVRFFGSWDLVGRESGSTGAFVWKVEHRHEYGTIPPKDFGFNLGYVGLFVPPFSDQGLRWTNLYWRQRSSSQATAGGVARSDPFSAATS